MNEAPPKQLANALEGLNRAITLIGDVRSGGERLLEAIESGGVLTNEDPNKPAQIVAHSVESVRRTFDQLRSTAKELEASGVLIGAQQRYQDNQPWGLHMPLVCPDGAVVAYSWKRQIAGQAAASAVDRTRLALKAFCEQKKRFLHIEFETDSKRSVRARTETVPLLDIPKHVQEHFPGMLVVVCARCKREKVVSHTAALVKVIIPDVLRAVISVLPVGSTNPDAIAVYSPNEVQFNDAWESSSYQSYQKISECASNALDYFTRTNKSSALMPLLHWLSFYRTLYSKPCRQCNKVLALDTASNMLLPPTFRAFRGFDGSKMDADAAYHAGCAPKSE